MRPLPAANVQQNGPAMLRTGRSRSLKATHAIDAHGSQFQLTNKGKPAKKEIVQI
jgi:hypothetical protein